MGSISYLFIDDTSSECVWQLVEVVNQEVGYLLEYSLIPNDGKLNPFLNAYIGGIE